MTVIRTTPGALCYALVREVFLPGVQDALDLIATVRYETGCDHIVLPKAALPEAFFDLKTRLAGEMLEKFVQYRTRLAVVGDFSGYDSKALRDFIRESNRGPHICFVPEEAEAEKIWDALPQTP